MREKKTRKVQKSKKRQPCETPLKNPVKRSVSCNTEIYPKNTPFSRSDLGQTLAEDTVFPEEENPHQNSAEETGQRSEKGRGTDPGQTFYVSSPWNMI